MRRQFRAVFPVLTGLEPDIDQGLRKQHHIGQQFRQRLLAAHAGLQHLQRTDQAVAGGVLVQRQQVAGALAAQQPATFFEFFQDVAVAHPGPDKLHIPGFERHFHGHVGHQGADGARNFFATCQALVDHQEQHFIAVEQPAFGIDHLQPVGIAIEGDAVVSTVGAYGSHQCVRMGCAETVVDVQAIGRAADGDHLGTKLMKHHGRDVIGRAMRAVDHNLQALERQVVGERAFAKFDVTPGGIVKPAGFSQ